MVRIEQAEEGEYVRLTIPSTDIEAVAARLGDIGLRAMLYRLFVRTQEDGQRVHATGVLAYMLRAFAPSQSGEDMILPDALAGTIMEGRIDTDLVARILLVELPGDEPLYETVVTGSVDHTPLKAEIAYPAIAAAPSPDGE